METDKKAVQEFWQKASCGEELYLSGTTCESYIEQARARYELEPYIVAFADFSASKGKTVLEVGVGLGADHQRFAESDVVLWGIDLTERGIEHVRHRLKMFNLKSTLSTGDAERLPFANGVFDLVYSWGVIHHSPNSPKAVTDIHRVLKPGGVAKVMIYHTRSLVGYMLWTRYALLRLRPWLSLAEVYARYLESPGTKAYSKVEAASMFAGFASTQINVVLTDDDLLESAAGQRHKGTILSFAKRFWPRTILRRVFRSHGLFMLTTPIK